MSTTTNRPDGLFIAQPDWLQSAIAEFPERLNNDRGKAGLAIYLASENAHRGGGPFGAVVFDGDNLVGAGVNQVLQNGLSLAHAEILALANAQRVTPDWMARPRAPFTLVSSAEPCCQCFGAIVWAGVSRLICAATTEDVQAIGFDEGPKPEGWAELLNRRQITVVQGLRREEAKIALQTYQRLGGAVYGPGARPAV
jgi:tRNA(Arg) A34 adenosine deaminase TadA